MKAQLKAATLTVLIVSSIGTLAQGNGVQPGSVKVGGPDVIGMNDLNIHLSIPLVSKQPIGLPFSMGLSFNNNLWNKVGSPAKWGQQNPSGITNSRLLVKSSELPGAGHADLADA